MVARVANSADLSFLLALLLIPTYKMAFVHLVRILENPYNEMEQRIMEIP